MTDESGNASENIIEETESDWVRRLQPGLRAVLLRWTRNVDTANDLCQDVMIAVIQTVRAGRLQNIAALSAYARQTAHNAWLMSLRKPGTVTLVEEPESETVWGVAPQTPEDLLTQFEMQRMVQTVLSEMSTERDRDLIRAFYLSGKSKQELMAHWQLNADQFDKVISRARDRMKKQLQLRLAVNQQTRSGAP